MNVILLTDGVLDTFKGKKHIATEKVQKGDSFSVDGFWFTSEELPTTFKVFIDVCSTYKVLFSSCDFIIKNCQGELLYTFVDGKGEEVDYRDRYSKTY